MAEILTGSPSSVCGENDDSPCLVPQRSVWGHALRGHVQTSEWAGLCSQGEHSWGWSTESGAEAEGHLEDVHRGGGGELPNSGAMQGAFFRSCDKQSVSLCEVLDLAQAVE